MKRLSLLLLLVTLLLIPTSLSAQRSHKRSGKSQPAYIVRTIPSRLNIEDKIFVENESSHRLTRVSVYLVDSRGKYQPLGNAYNLRRNRKEEIRSYKNDRLAFLKGRKIAVSVVGENGRGSSFFNVRLDDHRHDLYIEVVDR